MRKFMVLLIVWSFLFLPVMGYAETSYNDFNLVITGDEIYPYTDEALTCGKSGNEFSDAFFSAITLGGVQKTGWGSIVSPMTDAVGYTYPTDSGGVYRMYDAGYLALGAGTAVDTYILFDTDDDDFYFGRDDTDNDCAWGVGSTLGVDERITVVDSAVLTHIVIGDNVDAEDKYFIFDGHGTDQYLGYLDTYDMVCMGDGSTMDADMCFGIENASTPLLVLWNGIDGYGAVDIDYGSDDVTDHTFVSDGGTLILDGTITLTDSEVISNATDDTIRVASNDLDTILEVYTAYDTTGDATLKLSADLGDAAGEQWTFTSTGETTDLVIGCDDSVPGTPITRFTISDAGVVTTVAAQNFEIDDSANTTVTDIVNIQHFTSGTAGAGIGLGLTFDLENAAGTEEEHASIDVISAVATNGAEDTDFVVNLMTNGALAEVFRIDNDNEADAGTVFELTSRTEETNGVIDMLELELDNTADTADDGMGLGISILMDDETDVVEQQASLDFVLTDVTTTAENVDFVLSLNTIGTIREVLHIDTDNTATDNTLFQLTSWTLETDGVRDVLELNLDNTADTATDGFGLGISIVMEQEDAGTPVQQASIDFTLVDSTTAVEDCDVIVSQATAGAVAETLRLVANSSSTTSDYMQYTANTTETTVIHPVLVLATATGTAEDGHGVAISFRPEDAAGSEEQARIDVTQTTAANATNDTDFVFIQNLNGTLTETVRFDVDAGTITVLGATPIYFEGATADAHETILAVADAAGSDKTVTLPSITSTISLETAATTTITADTTATITVVPGTDTLYTYTIDTDDENCTLTFSAGGTAGDRATIIFITDAAGSQDEIMTFDGTLSDTEGTLTLATGVSKRYVITFVSDGTIWNEVSRTAVLG